MVFSVKYRKEDGTLDTLEVEAESRAAVFPLLEQRGIKAIRVDEVASKHGGWNKPKGANGARSAAHRSSPSAWRGIAAGALVVVLAVGGYFAFFASSEKPQEKVVEKKKNTIQEVAPVKVSPKETTPQKKELTKEEKRQKEIAEIEARYAGKEMPIGIKTHLYYLKNPPKISLKVTTPYDCLAYSSERSVAALVLTEPGTEFLDCLEFGEKFNQDFINALLSKNEPKEGDDDKTREMKKAVEEAKHEIARICKEEGKKPNEVMNEYAKTMYDLGKFERNLRDAINEARNNPDLSDSDVQDFFAAANKMREERGLPPMKVPSLARRGFMLAHRAERLQAEAAARQAESRNGK